jgi:hypothetical protein
MPTFLIMVAHFLPSIQCSASTIILFSSFSERNDPPKDDERNDVDDDDDVDVDVDEEEEEEEEEEEGNKEVERGEGREHGDNGVREVDIKPVGKSISSLNFLDPKYSTHFSITRNPSVV